MKCRISALLILIAFAVGSVVNVQAQWVQLKNLDTTLIVKDIAVDGYIVYVCDRTWNYAPDRLFRSSDDGIFWQEQGTGGIMTLAAIGSNIFGGSLWNGLHTLVGNGTNDFCCWQGQNNVWSRGTLLFFDGEHYGMNISSDSGQTWVPVPSGVIPLFGLDSLRVGSDTLNRVLRSTDAGKTWSPTSGLPDSPYYWITMSSSVLFATNGVTMFRSVDGGKVWAAAGNGLPNASLNVLAASKTRAFVATGNGVYVSTDAGDSWRNWSDGLGNDTVTCLSVSDGYVYAGTQGQGVWVRDVLGSSSVPTQPQLANEMMILPNPTTGIIALKNAPAGLLHVSVSNSLGENVIELTHPAASEVTVDLSKLPAGMYLIRVALADGVQVRKIVKE